jgi:hypothetical protein
MNLSLHSRTPSTVLALAILFRLADHPQDRKSEILPDPHRHVVQVHEEPWKTDLAPEARFVQMKQPADGRDTTVSPNGRQRAFVHEVPDEQGGRICLQETETGKSSELLGIPLPHRPISDLAWIGDTLLTFDRWSQPHYGIHYVIDVKQLKLVLSAPYPDELMLRQQQPPDDTTRQQH